MAERPRAIVRFFNSRHATPTVGLISTLLLTYGIFDSCAVNAQASEEAGKIYPGIDQELVGRAETTVWNFRGQYDSLFGRDENYFLKAEGNFAEFKNLASSAELEETYQILRANKEKRQLTLKLGYQIRPWMTDSLTKVLGIMGLAGIAIVRLSRIGAFPRN